MIKAMASMPTNLRRLNDFLGEWVLNRKVIQKDGPPATLTGNAVWRPEATGLLYEENGQLEIEGHAPMLTSRRYHWHPDLSVTFEDGRFFHVVPASGGATQHWCDPDHYAVAYDFVGWPVFQVTWQVTGPRKDYTMVSVYHRSGPI